MVLGLGTCTLNKTLQQNELRARTLNTAVSILRTEPNDKTRAVREWALKVFLKNSAIKPSKKAIEELKLSVMPSFVSSTNALGEKETNALGEAELDGAHRYLEEFDTSK